MKKFRLREKSNRLGLVDKFSPAAKPLRGDRRELPNFRASWKTRALDREILAAREPGHKPCATRALLLHPI